MSAAVLLAEEGARRGFAAPRYKHPALAFRRWCRRAGVRIIDRAGAEWVVPAEVDAAIVGASAPAPANELPPDVAAIVAAAKGGR
jgi:hypothetical protein